MSTNSKTTGGTRRTTHLFLRIRTLPLLMTLLRVFSRLSRRNDSPKKPRYSAEKGKPNSSDTDNNSPKPNTDDNSTNITDNNNTKPSSDNNEDNNAEPLPPLKHKGGDNQDLKPTTNLQVICKFFGLSFDTTTDALVDHCSGLKYSRFPSLVRQHLPNVHGDVHWEALNETQKTNAMKYAILKISGMSNPNDQRAAQNLYKRLYVKNRINALATATSNPRTASPQSHTTPIASPTLEGSVETLSQHVIGLTALCAQLDRLAKEGKWEDIKDFFGCAEIDSLGTHSEGRWHTLANTQDLYLLLVAFRRIMTENRSCRTHRFVGNKNSAFIRDQLKARLFNGHTTTSPIATTPAVTQTVPVSV